MIRFVALMTVAIFAWFAFSYLMDFPRWVDLLAVTVIAGGVALADRRLA